MALKSPRKKVLIIGAGPAGLAAAYEFYKQKRLDEFEIEVYEMDSQVGGLAKTLKYGDYRFDLGGHRFYTKFEEIKKFYSDFLGDEMLQRERLSRIYYGNKFYNYPLSASNALRNLGINKSTKIVLSWLRRQFRKYRKEETFDEWVSNRFGDELFKIFFKSYTEKVWGIPTSKLSADWAAQRIQNFNLAKAIVNAVFKINPGSKTIISKFFYPKFGPGMLYEKMKKILDKSNVKFRLEHEVIKLNSNSNHITGIEVKDKQGRIHKVIADYFISTMPFDQLVLSLNPPKQLEEEIHKLKFRNFITVNLVTRTNPFKDQWIYVHDPNVRVGRIQNFRNWSPFMAGNGPYTPIGMEYFSSEGDELWNMSNSELIDLAEKEIDKIGLVRREDVIRAGVYRVKNAYPVYDFDYEKPLEAAKGYIQKFTNLYLCGRGGLFRYNNQDHSILSGFYTARNIIAGNMKLDVWSINENDEYLESE